jgi:magnesium-transporting ATPase (P-type)
MLLLQGEVVVDEAKLTGESLAVRKVPYSYCPAPCRPQVAAAGRSLKDGPGGGGGNSSPAAADAAEARAATEAEVQAAAAAALRLLDDQPQAVLSGDTEVQVTLAAPGCAARTPVAVVLNSGFASAKGGMLRGMLHPTKHK